MATTFSLISIYLLIVIAAAVSLSAITDAANATERLYGVFEAEVFEETQINDPDLKAAVEIESAAFTWDTPPPQVDDPKKHKHIRGKKQTVVPAKNIKSAEEVPFKLHETNLAIPRGQLIAIVGPVGAGKTSLLQGLIGEMRRTSGSVKFGGSVSYCPQIAWIQVGLVNRSAVMLQLLKDITRMLRFVKMFALAVHSRRTGTGRPSGMLVLSLTWICLALRAISLKLEKGYGSLNPLFLVLISYRFQGISLSGRRACRIMTT